ncbi:MAG: glycosyltransferase family 4 protein [Longimicrobiales bacterium]
MTEVLLRPNGRQRPTSTMRRGKPSNELGTPPRVMFFHWNGDLYGASRSLWRCASRLAAEGGRPVVVLGQSGPLAQVLRDHGVEVRTTRWMAAMERSSLSSIRGLFGLAVRAVVSTPLFAVMIAREKPDVVHTNTSIVLTSGLAARLTGRPHVWHMREMFTEFPRVWSVYRRFVSAVSQRIVCISECVADQFHGDVRLGKVEVVHNGIPRAEVAAPNPSHLAELKNAFGLRGVTTVGVIGRINLDRKGQDVLVRAAATLASGYPDVRFVFVGNPYPGKEAEELRLRALIRQLGVEEQCVLTGEINDLPLIYGLLDVVVVPSPVPEPFGNTAPEAMAYGIPVVGSNRGGTAEIIQHGKTGLLFPPSDSDSLAACLELLLEDPEARRELGASGQQRFHDRFEFESCYRRIRRVFVEVARSTSAGERGHAWA